MNQHVIRTTIALIALTLALTALPAFAGATGTVNVNSAGVEQSRCCLASAPRWRSASSTTAKPTAPSKRSKT